MIHHEELIYFLKEVIANLIKYFLRKMIQDYTASNFSDILNCHMHDSNFESFSRHNHHLPSFGGSTAVFKKLMQIG